MKKQYDQIRLQGDLCAGASNALGYYCELMGYKQPSVVAKALLDEFILSSAFEEKLKLAEKFGVEVKNAEG